MTNVMVLRFYTVASLQSPSLWFDTLSCLEELLAGKLTHLDVNDPIRRRVDGLHDAAEYICSNIGSEEDVTVFGRFSKVKVDLEISSVSSGSELFSEVSIYFNQRLFDGAEAFDWLAKIFARGCEYFDPFYAFGDLEDQIAKKRKMNRFAVDLEAELIGMFWLTYFGERYVEYFGRDKIASLGSELTEKRNGLLLRLGVDLAHLDVDRASAEYYLGEKSFVDPALAFDKPAGEWAILFRDLKQ